MSKSTSQQQTTKMAAIHQNSAAPAKTKPVKRSTGRTLYIQTLLLFLPMAMRLFTLVSKSARQEHHYLPAGFVFALDIQGLVRCVVMQRTKHSWKRLRKDLPKDQIDYVIEFRDLDFAYEVFAANLTLKQALAGRLFATQGPNDLGVAMTYLFDAILRTLFFWRQAYRK